MKKSMKALLMNLKKLLDGETYNQGVINHIQFVINHIQKD